MRNSHVELRGAPANGTIPGANLAEKLPEPYSEKLPEPYSRNRTRNRTRAEPYPGLSDGNDRMAVRLLS